MRGLIRFFRSVFSDTFASPGSQESHGFLSEWARHAEAVVVEVIGSDLIASQVREFGVIPGARLRVLRTGNSLIVQLGEMRFAIRRSDAAAIRVCAPSTCSPPALAAVR